MTGLDLTGWWTTLKRGRPNSRPNGPMSKKTWSDLSLMVWDLTRSSRTKRSTGLTGWWKRTPFSQRQCQHLWAKRGIRQVFFYQNWKKSLPNLNNSVRPVWHQNSLNKIAAKLIVYRPSKKSRNLLKRLQNHFLYLTQFIYVCTYYLLVERKAVVTGASTLPWPWFPTPAPATPGVCGMVSMG